MRAATVVQVLQDLFYVLLHVLFLLVSAPLNRVGRYMIMLLWGSLEVPMTLFVEVGYTVRRLFLSSHYSDVLIN